MEAVLGTDTDIPDVSIHISGRSLVVHMEMGIMVVMVDMVVLLVKLVKVAMVARVQLPSQLQDITYGFT